MAMGYTATEICNIGLLEIPAQTITDLDDGSPPARALKLAYPMIKKKLLEKSAWTFATKRVTLAAVANDRPAEWPYKLALPDDAGMILRVVGSADTTPGNFATYGQTIVRSATLGLEGNMDARTLSAPFEQGNGVIYCDYDAAVLEYVDNSRDESFFPSDFAEALGIAVAAKVCKAIGRDQSTQTAMLQMAALAEERAMAADLNRQQRHRNPIPDVYTGILGG